jgi:hypothetical protein
MKRVNKMMYPKQSGKNNKKTACCVCGRELTPAQAFYYVDSCNCAITQNAKPHCYECMKQEKEKGKYI